jgi:hypothetical protein
MKNTLGDHKFGSRRAPGGLLRHPPRNGMQFVAALSGFARFLDPNPEMLTVVQSDARDALAATVNSKKELL